MKLSTKVTIDRRQHEDGVEREGRQYEKIAGARLRPREIGFAFAWSEAASDLRQCPVSSK